MSPDSGTSGEKDTNMMTGCGAGAEVHEDLPPRGPTPIPSIWGPRRNVTHRTTGPLEAILEEERRIPPHRRVMVFPEEQAGRVPTPFDVLKKGMMRVARVAFGHRSRFVFVS